MKRINLLSIVIIAVLAVSCGNSSESNNSVCIWDNVSLKDKPDESGKWICAISVGETVTYLEESKEDNSNKKTVTYLNVRLKDGTEGWVQSDFVVLNSKAAALTENADIYSRPNLLNKTGNSFSRMDIIAVKSEQDGFIEVVGKRNEGKWIETGWLKTSALTYNDYDIAVAKFARKIKEMPNDDKRSKEIMDIMQNPELSKSVFTEDLPLSAKIEEIRETVPSDSIKSDTE